MKSLKFWRIAISAGLLIGLPLGWHLGKTFTGGQIVLQEMSAAAGFGSLALLQYEQADAQHARHALLSFADFSKSMSKLPSAQGDKALLIDAGRTYLRLAALEELAGNSRLSHQINMCSALKTDSGAWAATFRKKNSIGKSQR